MFFFNGRNSEKTESSASMDRFVPRGESSSAGDFEILEEILVLSLDEIRAEVSDSERKISELKSSIEDAKGREKSVHRRLEAVEKAIRTGDEIPLTDEEIRAIQRKKSESSSSAVAFVSLSGHEKIQVERDLVVGRSGECDVIVPDSSVSRRHAMILKRKDGYWLEDLGSTNGTAVQDERIEPNTPFKLDRPCVITLGRARMFFAFR